MIANHPRADNDYPPIADYAVIGDCRTAALISRQGSIDWLCLPRFSSPAVFAALLDSQRGGRFAARPVEPATTQRRYITDTNVLVTTFTTATGSARITDLMPICPEADRRRYLQPQREIPRIIEGISNEVEMEIIFEPRPDYARASFRLSRRGELGWVCGHRDEVLILHADLSLHAIDDAAAACGRVRIAAGQKRYFIAHVCERRCSGDVSARRSRGTTARGYGAMVACLGRSTCLPGPLSRRGAAQHPKLLTYSLSGAIVAAPTTSLPEWIGGMRNWDYRFCWLRDTSLTLRAFCDLGFREEGAAFAEWLMHATRLTWPKPQVLYDVYGETNLPEELNHLAGYMDSRLVRIGNAAQQQLQLDIYGNVIIAACYFIKRGAALVVPMRGCWRSWGIPFASSGESLMMVSGKSAVGAASILIPK